MGEDSIRLSLSHPKISQVTFATDLATNLGIEKLHKEPTEVLCASLPSSSLARHNPT